MKPSERLFDWCKKNLLFIFTFLALGAKSFIFLSLSINQTHIRPMLFTALRMFREEHYHLIYYGLMPVAIVAFALLFRQKGRTVYLVVMNLLLSVILLSDIWYVRGYATLPSIHVLMMPANLDNMGSGVISMINPVDILFLLDLPVLGAILWFNRRNRITVHRQPVVFALALAISAGTMIGILPVLKSHGVGMGDGLGIISVYDANVTSNNISPFGYHCVNVYDFLKDIRPLNLSTKEDAALGAWFDKKENLPPNEYSGMFKGKNVFVLQVESLENFVLNQSYNGQEITPNINRIMKNSFYFDNIQEQVNQGMSSDSDMLLNSGLYPIRSGSTFFRFPFSKYTSLPSLLKEAGYDTQAIHPDAGSFWNIKVGLTNFGFDRVFDKSNFVIDEQIGLGLSDASFLRQIVPVIKAQKKPYFSFAVTLSSHMPFNLRQDLRELKMPEELDKSYMGGYLQSVRYTDKQIGVLLDTMDKEGLLDNTVVVMYGDHEGVHRYYPADVAKLSIQEPWWKDNGGRTPVLYYSKGLAPKTFDVTGGQIDTMPTLAALLGLDSEKYRKTTIGRNLLNTKQSFAVKKNREFIGTAPSEDFKAWAIEGLDVADKRIRSNTVIPPSK